MNSAHSFLSLGRSCSASRNRSARVASSKASTRSNFSGRLAPEVRRSSPPTAVLSLKIEIPRHCFHHFADQ